MLKFIKKIPAGTFLVPLVISMICFTFWPNLTRVGGLTEAMFSGDYQSLLVGMLCMFSGTGIKIKNLGIILKRQGVLLFAKLVYAIGLSLLYMSLFGQKGVLGVSALAFSIAITSINPSIYLSIVDDIGNEHDTAAFGLTGLFSIPFIPILIYSFHYATGSLDITPIISTLIPLLIGILLGNLDSEFTKLFSPGISATLPLLGWNIGQTISLTDAINSGTSGLALTIMFAISCGILFIVDKYILKNDGIVALALSNAAGLSASLPVILATMYPQISEFSAGATAQIVAVALITTILSPIIARKYYDKINNKK